MVDRSRAAQHAHLRVCSCELDLFVMLSIKNREYVGQGQLMAIMLKLKIG